MAAAAARFDRDLEADFARIERLIDTARADGVRLLALPEAALGGYLLNLDGAAGPPLCPDGPEIRRLARLAGEMVVAAGYCEEGPPQEGANQLFNSATCVTGDGVPGRHRKVHQPLCEDASYAAGSGFTAFDTPVGGRCGVRADLAVAELDVQAALETARRSMAHLRDRRPHAYTGLDGEAASQHSGT
jgi:predicted amidohydrolase